MVASLLRPRPSLEQIEQSSKKRKVPGAPHRVSTTLAKLVEKFAASVLDTGGNFTACVVDTGGKFAAGVVDTSGAP